MHSAWKLLSQCRHTSPTPEQHNASVLSIAASQMPQLCQCKGHWISKRAPAR